MASEGWIGVDLDGTLALYTTWMGSDSVGLPVERMVDRVKGWLAEGKDVRIFTARVWPMGTTATAPDDRVRDAQRAYLAIESWCMRVFGRALPITCSKDYGMVELWDDRAVQIVPNTGLRADGKA